MGIGGAKYIEEKVRVLGKHFENCLCILAIFSYYFYYIIGRGGIPELLGLVKHGGILATLMKFEKEFHGYCK